MRRSIFFALSFAALSAADTPPTATPWVLPNFGQRLEFQVSNPSETPVETLVIIPIDRASQIALRFPGSLAIAVAPGSPPAILPSQADDVDGDGNPDEFLIPVKLEARESRPFHIYYSTTLRDEIPWPRRVHASHAYGYNRATVALESELIGYRTYGGFFLDIQARAEGHPGLVNSLVGYAGTRSSLLGRDIIHLGDTLGLGGLFLRSGDRVYRPPLNMPDYAHKPSPEEVPHYRVIAAGPLRATVEARMDRWRIGDDEVAVRAVYSIAAGAAHVDCRFWITPLRVTATYEVGTGIRHLPDLKLDAASGRLALSGQQTRSIGPLAMALYYDTATAAAAPPLATKEDQNEVVVFKTRLAPGQAVSGRYSVAGAWSGTGIRDLLGHLRAVEPSARATVEVSGYRLTRTPTPDRVEGEAD